jgi:hypothetical protein
MKIDDVISAACEELNCSYESNALWFEVLIHQAVRSQKTSKKFMDKHTYATIEDSKFEMPAGWARLDGIYLYKTGHKYCPDIDYCLQNNVVIFDSSLGLQDGTKVTYYYKTLTVDKKNRLILPDDWERMLVAYIGWKYSRRYAKDFGLSVMQNFQREYQTQKLSNI